ncbi:NtaA/DmoA family FMN-dependent monooxygenase [Azotobacter vinelandii]
MKLGLLLNSPGGSRAGVVTAGPARPSLLSEYQEAVRQLEKARFDFAMVADTVFSDVDNLTPPRPEPVTLFAALAAVTSHIGLLSTVSTSFTEPFNLARQILSLDHLSNGRAAWNVVTSSAGERNFGTTPLPAHSERYRRGLEYVEVVRKLWDSWEEDALYLDTDRRLAVDAGKVHRIDHRGKFFSVEGPLNLSRSPQGQPVLFQAGSSEDGKAFAAHFAEGVYTAQHTLKEARQFYDDLKEKDPSRRAQSRPHQDPARPQHPDRRHRGGGPASGRATVRGLRPQRRPSPGKQPGRHRCERPGPGPEDSRGTPARPAQRRGTPEPLRHLPPARPGGRLDAAPVAEAAGGFRRARADRRHAGTGGRPHPGMVPQRRRGRLHRHAGPGPGGQHPVRRAGGADPAAARPVPYGLRGRHPARQPGVAHSPEPLRRLAESGRGMMRKVVFFPYRSQGEELSTDSSSGHVFHGRFI